MTTSVSGDHDERATGAPAGRGFDMDVGKRLVLFLSLVVTLLLTAAALWPTCWLLQRVGPRVHGPGAWVLLILAAVLVFNYAYVIALLLLRLVIPIPKEGFFPRRPDGRPPREATVAMLNFMLVRARHLPPWAATFTAVIVNIWPIHPIYRRIFGPNTSSATFGDSYWCLDPWMVDIGKGVQLGAFCKLSAHIFDQRGLDIKRIKIGDYAIIGGEAGVYFGAEIGHHAVVTARSMVLPNTKIGPYEVWSGMPARRRRTLSPDEVFNENEFAGLTPLPAAAAAPDGKGAPAA